MAEWSKAAVLKTVVPLRVPGVRIPLSPPSSAVADFGGHSPLEVCEGGNYLMYYVYILLCSDGKLYNGCTTDLRERIKKHNDGYVTSTKSRLPVQLMSYVAFSDKHKVFEFEKYLKSGSGRAFTKRHLLK